MNVTSQTWLNVSKAYGPTGSTWTHMVAIVVPKELNYKNISLAYLTGSCDRTPNSIPSVSSEDILVIDEIAHNSFSIAIAVF